MDKFIGNAVARDLYNALNDARASFSSDELREYDPKTIDEMFQYQFNVNIRVAVEANRQNNPLVAKMLEDFACHEFPDYNKILNVKESFRLAHDLTRSLRKMIADIRRLPALENEDSTEPLPSLNKDRRQPDGPQPI